MQQRGKLFIPVDNRRQGYMKYINAMAKPWNGV